MDYKKIMMAAQAAMQALLDKAKAESRVFTDEEKTSFQAKQKEFSDAQAMLDAETKAEEIKNAFKQPMNKPDVKVGDTLDPMWKNSGEFFKAVKDAATGSVDPRLMKNAATGMNETVPSEGGFLVPEQQESGITRKIFDKSVVASRCDRRTIGGQFNSMSYNELVEDSRVAGYRHGGIRAYWQAEAGTVSASKFQVKKRTLELAKLMAFTYVTEELLADSVGLESEINALVSDELSWKLDEAIYSVGTGAGMPLSVLNSDCIIEVAKEAGQGAKTIVFENILKMVERMPADLMGGSEWFINQDCLTQLYTMAMVVGTGGVPVYMPAGGVSASPYGTLFGRPVVPVEHAKTCGTAGDIVLANMNAYRLIEKGGISAEPSMHVRFLYDEMCYRFTWRINGEPKWTKALTPANGTNTLSPFVSLATRA